MKHIPILLCLAILPALSQAQSCDSGWQFWCQPGLCYCYTVIRDALDWSGAYFRCKEYGADLASIHSDVENKFVVDLLIGAEGGDAWIGFNDLANEGNFLWSDNTPVDFTRWHSGEPDNDNNEDCGELRDAVGYEWNDAQCIAYKKAICKKLLV